MLESIKKLFRKRDVIIQISSLSDETSYLLDDPENKKHLMESLAGEPKMSFSGEEFEIYVRDLLTQTDKPDKG